MIAQELGDKCTAFQILAQSLAAISSPSVPFMICNPSETNRGTRPQQIDNN